MFFLDEVYAKKNNPAWNNYQEHAKAQIKSPKVVVSEEESGAFGEKLERTSSGKRTSLFARPLGRSRSNTANSSDSSNYTKATLDASSRRSSLSVEPTVGHGHDATAKSSKAPPKIMRPENGIRAGWDTDTEDIAPSPERKKKLKGHRRRASDDPKRRISAPFDFHHIAHTRRQQLPSLDKDDPASLQAEYFAVRTNHIPSKKVTGIRVTDLHPDLPIPMPQRNNHTDLISGSTAMRRKYAPVRPKRSDELLMRYGRAPPNGPPPLPLFLRSLQTDQAGESNMNNLDLDLPPASTPPPLPPRRSSRRLPNCPPMLMEEIGAEGNDLPVSLNNGNSLSSKDEILRNWNPSMNELPYPTNLGSPFSALAQRFENYSPEPSPLALLSPSFSPGLELVPEEPEYASIRQSVDLSRRKSLRHSRSLPAGILDPTPVTEEAREDEEEFGLPEKVHNEPPNRPSSRASDCSDTLGGFSSRPTSNEQKGPNGAKTHKSPRRPAMRSRKSSAAGLLEVSWEEDIDFCYSNEAEANCEFDWSNTSRLEFNDSDEEDFIHLDYTQDESEQNTLESTVGEQTPELSEQEESQVTLDKPNTSNDYDNTFRTSLLIPSRDNIPELDQHSAHSASTNSVGALTPKDTFALSPSSKLKVPMDPAVTEGEGLMISPSLLLPQDFKEQMATEALYDDFLANYERSHDLHFTLLSDGIGRSSTSNKTEDSRFSKCTSLGSSIRSGPTSSPFQLRQSADSTTSTVPELEPSTSHPPVSLTVDTIVANLRKAYDSPRESFDSLAHPLTVAPPLAAKERDPMHLPATVYSPSPLSCTDTDDTIVRTPTPRSHKKAASDNTAILLDKPLPSAPGSARERSASETAVTQSSATTPPPKKPSGVVSRPKRSHTLTLFPPPRKPRKASGPVMGQA